MPRRPKPLTAAKVRTAGNGRWSDGDCLYLYVRTAKSAFWVFRYTLAGQKMREMGLGRARGSNAVSLAEARVNAASLHRLVRNGVDPLRQREAEADAAKVEMQAAAARSITFRAVARFFLDSHEAGWRNPKHRQQWGATLTAYAFPVMGDLPVGAIGTEHVMRALEPIWTTKPETAGRVRGRIEAVLDYAKVREWRVGENPARWKGHLANLLPARGKVRRVEHHAALPWKEIGAFFADLHRQAGIGAKALGFAVLTAARSGEVRGARWSEFDLQAAVWTIPAARMKSGREHRVPLSDAALALLWDVLPLRDIQGGDLTFPGAKRGRPLSDMSLTAVLRRMGRGDVTAHGFRSSFRDWAAEATGFVREVAEAALAHTLGDKVEAAYRRGDLFEKRHRLMEDWATFCTRPAPAGMVVPIRRIG